jgi:phosphate/sulfate permease
MHGLLRERSVTIMRRQRHLITRADALIQHFNPACRAARAFPELAASRLLLSLNDDDLPSHTFKQPACVEKALSYATYPLLLLYCASLSLLPLALHDALTGALVGGSVCAMILSLGVLASLHLYTFLIVIGVIVLLIAAIHFYFKWKRRKQKSRVVRPIANLSDEFGLLDDVLLDSPSLSFGVTFLRPRNRYSYRDNWFRKKQNLEKQRSGHISRQKSTQSSRKGQSAPALLPSMDSSRTDTATRTDRDSQVAPKMKSRFSSSRISISPIDEGQKYAPAAQPIEDIESIPLDDFEEEDHPLDLTIQSAFDTTSNTSVYMDTTMDPKMSRSPGSMPVQHPGNFPTPFGRAETMRERCRRQRAAWSDRNVDSVLNSTSAVTPVDWSIVSQVQESRQEAQTIQNTTPLAATSVIEDILAENDEHHHVDTLKSIDHDRKSNLKLFSTSSSDDGEDSEKDNTTRTVDSKKANMTGRQSIMVAVNVNNALLDTNTTAAEAESPRLTQTKKLNGRKSKYGI